MMDTDTNMAISLVSSVEILGTGGSGGTSSPINTTGANLLVISLSVFNQAVTPIVSDSFGNTWLIAKFVYDTPNSFGTAFMYCLHPTVGAGHTFSIGGSFGTGSAYAYSGVSALDQSNGTTDITGGTTAQTGSITPTANGALILASMASSIDPSPSTLPITINDGFTMEFAEPYTNSNYFGSATAQLIQGSAAAINPTFSWPGTGTGVQETAIVSFTPIAASHYSVPDCRNYGNFPNDAVDVNGTLTYTVPSVDSRAAGAPVDSRVSVPVACGTYPQNSRAPQ